MKEDVVSSDFSLHLLYILWLVFYLMKFMQSSMHTSYFKVNEFYPNINFD